MNKSDYEEFCCGVAAHWQRSHGPDRVIEIVPDKTDFRNHGHVQFLIDGELKVDYHFTGTQRVSVRGGRVTNNPIINRVVDLNKPKYYHIMCENITNSLEVLEERREKEKELERRSAPTNKLIELTGSKYSIRVQAHREDESKDAFYIGYGSFWGSFLVSDAEAVTDTVRPLYEKIHSLSAALSQARTDLENTYKELQKRFPHHND